MHEDDFTDSLRELRREIMTKMVDDFINARLARSEVVENAQLLALLGIWDRLDTLSQVMRVK